MGRKLEFILFDVLVCKRVVESARRIRVDFEKIESFLFRDDSPVSVVGE